VTERSERTMGTVNKRYQPTPALAPTERPVTEFRRWAAQFYPEMAVPVG
jgi:hypothetical protein